MNDYLYLQLYYPYSSVHDLVYLNKCFNFPSVQFGSISHYPSIVLVDLLVVCVCVGVGGNPPLRLLLQTRYKPNMQSCHSLKQSDLNLLSKSSKILKSEGNFKTKPSPNFHPKSKSSAGTLAVVIQAQVGHFQGQNIPAPQDGHSQVGKVYCYNKSFALHLMKYCVSHKVHLDFSVRRYGKT